MSLLKIYLKKLYIDNSSDIKCIFKVDDNHTEYAEYFQSCICKVTFRNKTVIRLLLKEHQIKNISSKALELLGQKVICFLLN
jgi:hypothetical protein